MRGIRAARAFWCASAASPSALQTALIALAVLTNSACSGLVPEGGGDDDGKGGAPGTVDVTPRCKDVPIAQGPLRRLKHAEYNASLQSLLGEPVRPADAFSIPQEISPGSFASDASRFGVSARLLTDYANAAIALAPKAVAVMKGAVPCVANPDEACARQYAKAFGLRTFRRPLTEAEVDRFAGLYTTVAAEWDGEHGLHAIAEAMLQSPHFLYRVEVGVPDEDAPDRRRLTAFELAARLSYFIWGTTPSDELLAMAADGKLSTRKQVVDVATKMGDDRRSDGLVHGFAEEWLELYKLGSSKAEKDRTLYPSFSPELLTSMRQEALAVVDEAVWSGEGLTGLLGASYSFVDAPLAEVHGVVAPAKPFGRVELDANARSGVLTLPAVLTVQADSHEGSPIYRGIWIRHRFLCQEVPSPPANDPDTGEPIMPVPFDPNVSVRQRFEEHRTRPACRGCHELMDPIGVAFEGYDAIGRVRNGGAELAAEGEILHSATLDGKFAGPVGLAEVFRGSREVNDCFAKQWFQHAMGRPTADDDQCSLDMLAAGLADAKGDVRALIPALVETDAFLFLPEVAP